MIFYCSWMFDPLIQNMKSEYYQTLMVITIGSEFKKDDF